MNETLPPPPAESTPEPTPAPAISAAGTPTKHPVAVAVIAAALGVAAALVVGGVIGWLAFATSETSCSPADGWCGLGAVLVGMFAGIVAGGLAYLAVGVVAIHRLRPPTARWRHVVLHLAIPPGLILTLVVVTTIADALR